MRPHLVIARAGPASLHPTWVAGARERSFDLVVCPYAPGVEPGDRPDLAEVRPGYKVQGLAALLEAWPGWRDYAYVWLPDDDLGIDAAGIDRLFAACQARGAALAQPALSARSSFSHLVTVRNPVFVARETTFVEIMAPCFRTDVLERLRATFAAGTSGQGWGLDDVWPFLLGAQGVWVFDDVVVDHLRPVGLERGADVQRRVEQELQAIHRRFGCTSLRKTRAGWRADGTRLAEDDPAFLETYLGGYAASLPRVPAARRRLLREQARDVAQWLRTGGWPGLGARAGRAVRWLRDHTLRRLRPRRRRPGPGAGGAAQG